MTGRLLHFFGRGQRPPQLSKFVYCACCSVMTIQRLSLEIGFDSWMNTWSPTLWALFSSCALYFLVRRTVFFITGCVKRRSTLTTTVFSFLSLTTVPCRMRFGMVLTLLGRGFFRGDGLDARDVPADLLHARGLLELTGGLLEAQVELLLLQAG